MGYYSDMDITMEKVSAGKEKVSRFNNLMEAGKLRDFGDFRLVETEDGNLDLISTDGNYSGKFYDTDELAFLLAKTIDSGEITLMFTGEDGGKWGYKIKPNEVRELLFTFEVGDVMKEPDSIASWLSE